MKTNHFKSKFTSLLLAILFLLQSCVAYKSTTSTFDEAVATNGKVLVIKNDGTKLKLKKIEKIDGVYYGVVKTKKGLETIPLTESDYKRISIKDKTASTLGNIGYVIGGLAIIVLTIGAISVQNMEIDLSY